MEKTTPVLARTLLILFLLMTDLSAKLQEVSNSVA
jgi:hypothetical protein